MILPPLDFASNNLRLADWMELSALVSADGNYSAGDLQNVLADQVILVRPPPGIEVVTPAGGGWPMSRLDSPLGSDPEEVKDIEDFETEDMAVEFLSIGVLQELEYRAGAGECGYPFSVNVDGGLLETRADWEDQIAYVFCLCLSYYGADDDLPDKARARRMFEHVAKEAAQAFVRGEALRFGHPRQSGIADAAQELPGAFNEAIDELCDRIDEGDGFCPDKFDEPMQEKDEDVDIVAWRDFPDGAPGKLLLLGNCASGHNWEGKLKDLQILPFRDWIVGGLYSPILRSFFVPHRLVTSGRRWKSWTRDGGILFERCRIARLARLADWETTYCTNWCSQVLEMARNGDLQ